MRFEENFINKNNKIKFFSLYTILFVFFSILIFSWYFFTGKNFIYTGDGFNQHYPAYIYYSRWLRKIAKNIFINHVLTIPTWDFNIGYGSDVIKTLCYYVIGDPFCLPLVFVPSAYVNYYYNFSVLLRLYCAGLAFFMLCREFSVLKEKSTIAVLAGAFSYIFYFYAIYNVARHPFFLNPLVFFPMIICGLERIIKKGNPFLFVTSVALSSASNLYFFYMIVLFTIVYGVVREICIYGKNVKLFFSDFGRVLLWALLGVGVSAFIVFPVIFAYLGDSRNTKVVFTWFYGVKDTIKMILSLFTLYDPNWTTLAFSIPSCLAIFICLFKKNHSKTLKISIVICLLILVFPFLGQVINCFSYVSNRWSWVFALIAGVALCYEWDDIKNLSRKEFFLISLGICFLFMLSFVLYLRGFNKKHIFTAFVQLFLLFILCVICLVTKNAIFKERVMFSIVCCSILFISCMEFSPRFFKYVNKGTTKKQLQTIFDNDAKIVKDFKDTLCDNDFNRYSSESKSNTNISLIAEIPGTQYYWTLSNPYIVKFNRYMEFSGEMDFKYNNLDYRTPLNALCSVKYYYSSNNNIPYGFVKSGKENIYINQNSLPFGFCYDNSISLNEWEQLDSVSKQETLLQKAVLDKTKSTGKSMDYFHNELPYTIIEEKDLLVNNNSFVVQKKGASLELSIPEISDKEIYILFENLYMSGSKKRLPECMSLSFFINDKEVNGIKNPTLRRSWYTGRSNFTVCLSYVSEIESVNKIKIVFNEKGTYKFDSIKVIAEDEKRALPYIEQLRKETLKNVKISEDVITGDITVDKDKILMLNIPYEKGWKAYVDGEEQKILQCNVMFSGLELSEGSHSIILEYKTPGMCIGFFMSLISLCIIILLFIKFGYLNKKNN